MNTIENKHIDPRLLTTKFACDLRICKGSCCTFPGGTGAPIQFSEIAELQKAWPIVKHLLPQEHRTIGESYGLVEMHRGHWYVRCYKQRACIFVMYEKDIAFCSMQYAHKNGKLDFPKPESCHLFPLRVNQDMREDLYFEEFSECRSALQSGETNNVPLVEFLEEPITRVFGKDFYGAIKLLSSEHTADQDKK